MNIIAIGDEGDNNNKDTTRMHIENITQNTNRAGATNLNATKNPFEGSFDKYFKILEGRDDDTIKKRLIAGLRDGTFHPMPIQKSRDGEPSDTLTSFKNDLIEKYGEKGEKQYERIKNQLIEVIKEIDITKEIDKANADFYTQLMFLVRDREITSIGEYLFDLLEIGNLKDKLDSYKTDLHLHTYQSIYYIMKDPARYNTKKIEKILQRDLSDKRYVMRCYGYLYRLDRENSITYLPDIIRICKNQPDRVFVALYNLDDKDMKDRIVKKIDETDFTKQFDKEELDTFNTAIEKLKNKK